MMSEVKGKSLTQGRIIGRIKLESEQSMTQAITQAVIKANKAAEMVVRQVETPANIRRQGLAMLKQVVHC